VWPSPFRAGAILLGCADGLWWCDGEAAPRALGCELVARDCLVFVGPDMMAELHGVVGDTYSAAVSHWDLAACAMTSDCGLHGQPLALALKKDGCLEAGLLRDGQVHVLTLSPTLVAVARARKRQRSSVADAAEDGAQSALPSSLTLPDQVAVADDQVHDQCVDVHVPDVVPNELGDFLTTPSPEPPADPVAEPLVEALAVAEPLVDALAVADPLADPLAVVDSVEDPSALSELE
jgi:hypothetical protein